eukprot:TRINITY_DN18414_c0_g1_i3.p1 TRINITY_DN18414_c0_g1~~TRINITY_DN18414_c0_g1_i3.p1  ORF type:complete len:471 (-),score=80.34 TRINITY_DN18414_c0_g1_i3:28-1323(-)
MVRAPSSDEVEKETMVCIGDVHGQADALKKLWEKLTDTLGADELAAATVIFLGDYCDRGPKTREALDFMIQLRDMRVEGKTVFLCGNHDLGMAAFLGHLPTTQDVLTKRYHGDLDKTKKPEFTHGFWDHEVEGGMHYQGRRWGGSNIYQAANTFASYGLGWDPNSPESRTQLIEAVPDSHKQFLSSLKWVYEQAVPWPPGKVTCVHAGLIPDIPAEPQLEALIERDLGASILHDGGDPGRIASFSAREVMLAMHPDLENKSLLVSGHHGAFYMEGNRIVNDRNGGRGPMEAVILPDVLAWLQSQQPGKQVRRVLSQKFPNRFASLFWAAKAAPAIGVKHSAKFEHTTPEMLLQLARLLKHLKVAVCGTEGYPKAEVTCGGIATSELCPETMEAKRVPGLFVVGEAVDVTGWLGGYNFQWAWASGYAAGCAC